MQRRRTGKNAFTLLVALALLAAGCGGDDDEADVGAAPVAAEEEGGDDGGDAPSGGGCDGEVDDSLDEEFGVGAGLMRHALECSAEQPLEADDSLEPIVLAFENAEGDPSYSFPDQTAGTRAAVEFINSELGGIGSDLATGTPGRPIQLETCFITLNPADSTSCANELAAKQPDIALMGFNTASEGAYPVLQGSGAVTMAGVPVGLADFQAEGVFAPGPGGGCVGAHPGLVEYAVNELGARRVAVVWLDIPTGVVCYHDLTKKPLNVLQGSFPGPEGVEGSVPDLEYTDVPIQIGAPDLTAAATQVMDYGPDAILYSGPVGSCVSLMTALASVGWDSTEVPAVLSGSCWEPNQIQELGEIADGLYFVAGKDPSNPENFEEGSLYREESERYVELMESYEPEAQAGQAAGMFQAVLSVWQVMAEAGIEASEIDADAIRTAISGTVDHHMFAASPFSCAEPVEPYTTICNPLVVATQWDVAEQTRSDVTDYFSGAYIIEGTELDPVVTG